MAKVNKNNIPGVRQRSAPGIVVGAGMLALLLVVSLIVILIFSKGIHPTVHP